jgi:CRP-like cAMP-binding protein
MSSFLSSISLFSGLEANLLEELGSAAKKRSFIQDEIIFRSGEMADKLHLVTKGVVKLFNSRPGSAKEETVCVIHPGGFFCLAPVINKEELHINAKALQDVESLELSSDLIHDFIERSHPFAKNIIRHLSRKECDLCEEVCNLSLSTTKERLAKYLLDHADPRNISKAFSLRMNQTELASVLGTVRETVSRDLSDLRKSGLISLKQQAVSILNEEELKKLCSFKEKISSLPVL